MIKRTNYFSLIEVIIAASLFGILLFTTTSLFFRYHKLNANLNGIREEVLERTLFYEKLLDMSSSIDKSTIAIKSPLYEDFLSFIFDNGFKDNARLSGRCLCTLYRAPGNIIKYEIKNGEKNTSTRVLLQGVTSFKSKIKGDLLYIEVGLINNLPLSYCFELPKKEAK
ncbi:MAG: hypothetical protein SP4CHLAM5_10200 [Chlamydiia bacterium]|nr:hypothetical protein [Chlamydiia bacterium]MCH9618877.1 hypothetical protein [Chlamydiia bacterium]MCH9623962.1 hypothetical protein [Chlamydiia bacterium]